MSPTKKSFVMYKSWNPMIQALLRGRAGDLIKAIFAYQITGEEPNDQDPIYPMFCLIKAKFEEDEKAYEDRCKQNAEAANKRWKRSGVSEKATDSVRMQQDASGCTRIQVDEPPKVKKFIPPSVDEVRAYCNERRNTVDPQTFVDFYTSKGWKIGKDPMKDWKAAVRTWERNRGSNQQSVPNQKIHNFQERTYDYSALEQRLTKN